MLKYSFKISTFLKKGGDLILEDLGLSKYLKESLKILKVRKKHYPTLERTKVRVDRMGC